MNSQSLEVQETTLHSHRTHEPLNYPLDAHTGGGAADGQLSAPPQAPPSPELSAASADAAQVELNGHAPARSLKRGKVPVSLYLSPGTYWSLRTLSRTSHVSMQVLLRDAIDEILKDPARQA
jgi:hypothetical protein